MCAIPLQEGYAKTKSFITPTVNIGSISAIPQRKNAIQFCCEIALFKSDKVFVKVDNCKNYLTRIPKFLMS